MCSSAYSAYEKVRCLTNSKMSTGSLEQKQLYGLDRKADHMGNRTMIFLLELDCSDAFSTQEGVAWVPNLQVSPTCFYLTRVPFSIALNP